MTGRPAPEVIQEWADGDAGWTFERGRMERNVNELWISRAAAEKALRASVGDVTLAVKSIVLPREDL
ncbi:hypothetical protein CBOM_06909 [Ceraceosorus bombacis]|uniref:Uncharacterized protein n=1 Tax=Ceraceosorus bombacis TaxID=401625 RepID=A0A0N7LBK0_9BASI|nr:hypothetical protein CBOM_06909 [Ceraceosorus bombacis]